jgi:hypothetical protein
MSGIDQKALGTLLTNIEGLTGLFETLIEAEIIANNSATVQAQNAATSAAAAATSAASVTSLAATVAADASTAVTAANNAGTNATNAGASANTATTQATNATTAASQAQAAAAAAQAVQQGLQTIYTLNTTGGPVALNATQAAAGIIWVQGALQSNLTIVMPATVHPFVLDNATTGPYSVTVVMSGGTANATVGQGNANQLFCDGSTGIYSVSSVSGLQFTNVKAISAASNALTNQYQGAYTPMTNGTGSTYSTTLPQGTTMGVGGAVFLDAISGNWTITPYSGDTADFGASFAMNVADKAMFTWNGSSWRTTLYSNQISPVFKTSLTVPVALITRGVFGGVADDTTTAVQATTGRFTTSLTVPTMAPGDNSFNAASTAYVMAAINNLIGGAPGNLDTLKELADAINDDTSFASTITNLVAAKAALSGATFTGAVSAPSLTSTGGAAYVYGWNGQSNQGVIYLDQAGTHYLYFDGSNYNLVSSDLYIMGYKAYHTGNFNPANYAALAGAASFGGKVTGTAANGALVATNGSGTGQTSIILNRAGAPVDNKNWELLVDGSGTFVLRAVNDAYSSESDVFRITRPSGYTLGALQVMAGGGRTLFGSNLTDDGSTTAQVSGSMAVQRPGSASQSVAVTAGVLNQITSYSAVGNASPLVINATTDAANDALTAGSLGLWFQVYGSTKMQINPNGHVLFGTATDDGTNLVQVNGGIGIKGTGNGITFPDGTTQTTGYAVTAPSVQSYTPANGVSTFAVQTYGLGLIMGFANNAFMVPGTDYTATTGNSVTLTTPANGRTTYTFLTGSLFNASNVLQPQVAQVSGTVGNVNLTLPFSAMAGYLWLFQGGDWLVPGQDFTFSGGTAVTLNAAPTQSTDSFTAISLQPVSFANCATQTNVQNAQLTFAMDTGAANAYAVAYIPALTGTPTNGMQLSFFANVTNTGASTLACNGGTAYAIYGNGHAQLTGGEIVAGGFVEVAWSSTLGAWILLECTGGAQQFSGNVNLVGTAQRIRGDFSNATFVNRVSFQTSTINGNTLVATLPNGTASISGYNCFSSADPTNSTLGQFANYGTDVRIQASFTGTGSYIPLSFWTGGALRWQITTGGQLLYAGASAGVGAWGTGIHSINTTVNTYRQVIQGFANNQGYGTIYINGSEQSTTCNAILFINSGGTQVGGITVSTSATAYNTTSDYRLKENIKPLKGALDRVMRTRVITYNFVNDENKEEHDGFLAHELAETTPRAVTGKKDSVHRWPVLRDGHDPKDIQPEDVLDIAEHIDPQLVDHSKAVPLLWAAIQELKHELNEARIEIARLKRQKQ